MYVCIWIYVALSGSYIGCALRVQNMFQNVEGAQHDAIIALFLDPSNRDVVSLMARLYPGKSIREIMSSLEAVRFKKELDKLTAYRKPKKQSQKLVASVFP